MPYFIATFPSASRVHHTSQPSQACNPVRPIGRISLGLKPKFWIWLGASSPHFIPLSALAAAGNAASDFRAAYRDRRLRLRSISDERDQADARRTHTASSYGGPGRPARDSPATLSY